VKAYVEIPEQARSLVRVRDALAECAPPTIEITQDRDAADLVVLHVNGRRDRSYAQAERAVKRGQKYAVIQYAVRSTRTPTLSAWAQLWASAVVTWSYLDLAGLILPFPWSPYRFHRAPLGVSEAFQSRGDRQRPSTFLAATSGLSWLTESVREVALAVQRLRGRVFHLGPNLNRPGVTCQVGISDAMIARAFQSCEYVSGLRRIEGFEMPAAEGLVCGARPVLFDREHYRHWYGELAEYIEEGDRPSVIDQLEALFRRPIRRVTKAERDEGRQRFDWRQIIEGFWQRCGA